MSSTEWRVLSFREVGGIKRGEGLNFSYHGEQDRIDKNKLRGFWTSLKAFPLEVGDDSMN